MTLRKEAPRKKARWSALGVAVTAALLLLASVAFAGAAATSGFEGADGNLVHNTATDWNDFAAGTNGWTGTAPYQSRTELVSGWSFNGLTDAQASTTDTGFAGGTKQDKDCAGVNGSKAPNKDDLKRVYLASKTLSSNNHTYLALAWERIPQNTVNASAHVGFEFNQGTTPCGSGHDGLVFRQAGDMLIVYDFEGSSSGAATLTLRRWVTSGSCEISQDSAPCWGPAATLTSVGGDTAEALVDAVTFPVSDSVAIGSGSPARTTADSLGQSEFGEAIVDLSNAGVFTPGTCASFGQAEAVSRSSGNSGQAAMEDLVGPATFNLTNCGTVIIRKVTVPSPDVANTSFGFTDNVVSSPVATNSPFSLKNGEHKTMTNVVATTGTGTYTVTENDPSLLTPAYTLDSISCTASSNVSGNESTTTSKTNRNVIMTIGAGDTVDCTFTNSLNKTQPGYTSSPSVIPQDSVSLTNFDTNGDHTGTLTVSLYGAGDSTCSSAAVYTKTFTSVATAGPFKTDNSGDPLGTPAGYTISADGTYNWQVSYSGDSHNKDFTGTCGDESITVGLVSK